MDLQVNQQSQLPIHAQLRVQLTRLIQTGEHPPGTKFATVRQLAGFLRINRNTAARVFTDLKREGYLSPLSPLRCATNHGGLMPRSPASTQNGNHPEPIVPRTGNVAAAEAR